MAKVIKPALRSRQPNARRLIDLPGQTSKRCLQSTAPHLPNYAQWNENLSG